MEYATLRALQWRGISGVVTLSLRWVCTLWNGKGKEVNVVLGQLTPKSLSRRAAKIFSARAPPPGSARALTLINDDDYWERRRAYAIALSPFAVCDGLK